MNNKNNSQKMVVNDGYKPTKSSSEKFGYQPTKNESNTNQNQPPKKP